MALDTIPYACYQGEGNVTLKTVPVLRTAVWCACYQGTVSRVHAPAIRAYTNTNIICLLSGYEGNASLAYTCYQGVLHTPAIRVCNYYEDPVCQLRERRRNYTYTQFQNADKLLATSSQYTNMMGLQWDATPFHFTKYQLKHTEKNTQKSRTPFMWYCWPLTIHVKFLAKFLVWCSSSWATKIQLIQLGRAAASLSKAQHPGSSSGT